MGYTYTYTLDRSNFASTYDAGPNDVIDVNLNGENTLYQDYKADTYTISLNGFLGSPGGARYADISILVKCNNSWYELQSAKTILLLKAPERDNYNFSGQVPLVLQSLIGQYGIQDVQFYNNDYNGNGWKIRAYKTGAYGTITFTLSEDMTQATARGDVPENIEVETKGSIVKFGSLYKVPFSPTSGAQVTFNWSGESGYAGTWDAFRVYYREAYTSNDIQYLGQFPTVTNMGINNIRYFQGTYNFSSITSARSIEIFIARHKIGGNWAHSFDGIVLQFINPVAPTWDNTNQLKAQMTQDNVKGNFKDQFYILNGSFPKTTLTFSWPSAVDNSNFYKSIEYKVFRNGVDITNNNYITNTKFEWSPPSDGANNIVGTYTIKAYGVFNNDNNIRNETNIAELSSKVTITIIDTSPLQAASFNNDLPEGISNNVLCEWEAINKPTAIKKIQYRITLVRANDLSTAYMADDQDNTTYKFLYETDNFNSWDSVNNVVPSYYLRLSTIYYAVDGGRVSKATKSNTFFKLKTISDLISEKGFSYIVFDPKNANESNTNIKYEYAFDEVAWQLINPFEDIGNRKFQYKIKYTIDSAVPRVIPFIDSDGDDSNGYIHREFFESSYNFQSINSAIIITDNYNNSYEYYKPEMKAIQLVPKPKIEKKTDANSYISNVDATKIQIDYNYITNYPNDTVLAEYTLCYDDKKTTFKTKDTLTDIKIANSRKETWGNRIINPTEDEDAIWHALKTEILENKNPTPKGKIIIKLSRKNMEYCQNIIEEEFNFNFKVAPVESYDKRKDFSGFVYEEGYEYFQEGDKIKIKIPVLNWQDIFNSQKSAIVQYTITGMGSFIEGQQAIMHYAIEGEGTYTDGSHFIYSNFVAPAASKDLPLQYQVSAQLIYSNGEKIDCGSIIIEGADVARWTDKDNIGLADLMRTADAISGKLILPDELCSSIAHENLSVETASTATVSEEGGETSTPTISYYKIIKDGNTIIKEDFTYEQFYGDSSSNPPVLPTREIAWNYEIIGQEGDITIKAEVGFINAKDTKKKFIKITPIYTVYADKVPLAIRKGRVGVNISSVDFKEEKTAIKNSALKIFSAPNSYAQKSSTPENSSPENGTTENTTTKNTTTENDATEKVIMEGAPVVEIEADGNITNPIFLRFLHEVSDTTGSKLKTADFYLGNDGQIHCDNFYYPKQSQTVLNEITGEKLTLSFLEQVNTNSDGTVALKISNGGEGATIIGKVKGWDKVLCFDDNNIFTNESAQFNIKTINIDTIHSKGTISAKGTISTEGTISAKGTISTEGDLKAWQHLYLTGASLTNANPAIIFEKNNGETGSYRTGKIQYQNGLSLFAYRPNETAVNSNYWRFYLPTPPTGSTPLGMQNYEIITTQAPGATEGGALRKLGIVYSKDAPTNRFTGMIWLQPRG